MHGHGSGLQAGSFSADNVSQSDLSTVNLTVAGIAS